MQSEKKIKIIIDIAILIIAAIVLGITMAWSQTIELKLGLLYYVDASDADAEDIVELKKAGAAGADAELRVHFVDVGQGDCTIIELPDGKTMVIDGAENRKTHEQQISTFIQNTLPEDFKYFDYAILTHPDSDHCGSFDYVLDNYPARKVYRPNVEAVGTSSNPYTDPGKADLTPDARTKDTAVYASAVEAMYKPNDDFTPKVYITNPSDPEQTISGGTGDNTYYFRFYSPLGTKYTGEGDWNNYSPVMILEYRGFKYAMSGDAEEKNLGEFVQKVAGARNDGVTDKYDDFDDNYCVNVIKAGHHGSGNATTAEYLDVITTPEGAKNVYCVISCGLDNKYNHPHDAAIQRYKAIGVKDENILRTDQKGDITISVKMGDDGNYALFYGENAVQNSVSVLVYRKIGGVKLKWPVVAWTAYAVLVIVGIVYIIYVCNASDDGKRGGKGGGRKSGSRRQS